MVRGELTGADFRNDIAVDSHQRRLAFHSHRRDNPFLPRAHVGILRKQRGKIAGKFAAS